MVFVFQNKCMCPLPPTSCGHSVSNRSLLSFLHHSSANIMALYSRSGAHKNIKTTILSFFNVDNSAFGKARKESKTIGEPVN